LQEVNGNVSQTSVVADSMAKDIAQVNNASIEISQSSEHIKNNANEIFWCQSKSRHAPLTGCPGFSGYSFGYCC